MDAQKFILATVAGGITLFVLGYVFWGLLFLGFFEANSTADLMKDPPVWWALCFGQLAFAALLTLIIGRWARTTGVGPAAKTAALAGFLMALGFDFTLFGTQEMMTLTAALVDPVLVAVQTAIAGAVIGMVLGRGSQAAD